MNNNTPIIEYKRKKNREPIGVVLALSPTEIGWAMCSKHDTFSKERGKEIAFGRAVSPRKQHVPPALQGVYNRVKERAEYRENIN